MEYSSVISEIAHDGKICMEPMAYHAYRSMMFSNIELGAKVVVAEKEHAEKVVLGQVENQARQAEGEMQTASQYIFPSDAFNARGRAEFYASLGEDDEVVNVITIAGPMTRGGGACSYGSIDHRDLIIEAAQVPQVKSHIFLTRTPGGMASTLRDYRMALNYAHAHGQKIYMLCNGDVASGGAFAGTVFDGIYAINPDDEIGSLGMYCAFFTQKDGDKNSITQETYREYYASKSKDKNAFYRAAAEGDMSIIAEEVEKDLEQLLANVRADRPKVKKDQLTGKMYRMGDVKGSLVDGFMSLNELAIMSLKEWHKRDGAVLPEKKGGVVKGKVESDAEPLSTGTEGATVDSKGEPLSTGMEGAMVGSKGEPLSTGTKETIETTNTQTPKTQEQMKNYPNLGKVAGLEDALELQTDGFVSLSEEQADVMESAIEKAAEVNEATQTALTDAQAQVETLTNEKDTLEKQLSEANAKVEELTASLSAKEEELAAAQANAETATADAQKAHEEEVANLQKQLEDAQTELASREATINDLNTTIEELNASAGEKGNGGGAPQNNGKGAEAPTYSMEGRYDHSLSPAENRRRIEAYNAKLEKMKAQGL